ncbi:MAG TPA: helix-hairpin-helix domain-containing protein [Candidatus Limnocylindria bacterium]|nr:helix-hairpin-helix domain-containing protein [Candidatus Limnocylindria bacterium]
MNRGRAVLGGLLLVCALSLALYIGAGAARKALNRGTVTLFTFAPPQAPPAASLVSGPMDLNSASMGELMSLPGIGEHLAREIILARERRPFSYLEDLATIPGIGERRIEALRPLVCVLPP